MTDSWEKRFEALFYQCTSAPDVSTQIHMLARRAAQAEVALEGAGWTIEDGAEAWKPPIGRPPRSIIDEGLELQNVALERKNRVLRERLQGMELIAEHMSQYQRTADAWSELAAWGAEHGREVMLKQFTDGCAARLAYGYAATNHEGGEYHLGHTALKAVRKAIAATI